MMEEEIKSMITARDVSATLKTELATLRSTFPSSLIFCFEGVDDKPVYFQWICRIHNKISYESFVCNGKSRLLSLKTSLENDLGNLKDGVYLYADRDFDDLRGHKQGDFTYTTSHYSIENYLTTSAVVENYLKNEFHCLNPAVRSLALESFDKAYRKFLECTQELNFRLYCARKLNITVIENIPNQANKLALIAIDDCTGSGEPAQNLIKLHREPTEEEKKQLQPQFSELDPQTRYRGKFAMAFFTRWLDLLARDYRSPKPKIFEENDQPAKVKGDICELGRIASKSAIPHCLEEFVKQKILPKYGTV